MAERPRISLLYEFFVTSQKVRALLARAMADAPLRPDEYAVYSILVAEGPLTPTAMARGLGMPITTLHEYVRVLLERGHASKSPTPGDRRSYQLSLTPPGLRTHQEAGAAFDEANQRLLAALDLDESDHARALHDLQLAADTAAERLSADTIDRAG